MGTSENKLSYDLLKNKVTVISLVISTHNRMLNFDWFPADLHVTVSLGNAATSDKSLLKHPPSFRWSNIA